LFSGGQEGDKISLLEQKKRIIETVYAGTKLLSSNTIKNAKKQMATNVLERLSPILHLRFTPPCIFINHLSFLCIGVDRLL
jgi:hypothetical protein